MAALEDCRVQLLAGSGRRGTYTYRHWLGTEWQGILEAAVASGVPVTRVALTHAHADHAGPLDEIYEQLPEAEFASNERTTAFLRGEMDFKLDEPQEEWRGTEYKLKEGWPILLKSAPLTRRATGLLPFRTG